jgi:CRP/FNR family cyclic AMP-dependent transcriptional regulator
VKETETAAQDPLLYLPRNPTLNVVKSGVIYNAESPAHHLYVVLLGRVKIITSCHEGFESVASFVRTEGIFGESCLVPVPSCTESAEAMDNVTLMAWTRDEIERQIERDPRLGLALSRYVVYKCLELQDRIETMAVYKTPERVMLAMLQLANELGTVMPDGAMRVNSLTHFLIAEYVGTSREIVTVQMNRLRRLGVLKYSRKHLDIYPQAIQEDLRRNGIAIPYTARGAYQ